MSDLELKPPQTDLVKKTTKGIFHLLQPNFKKNLHRGHSSIIMEIILELGLD